ncbi:AraC family transcriptional regulator [Saccharomonospora sp. NPDC046836]|uniref:AraC family transcriptional regulator n=1 Tax=Saccharomonospora sp. NPDC046836 TaxID=3156921 RepID=UPI0033C99920
MMQRPLSRFPVFHSQDLDVVREALGSVFCAHRLYLAGRDSRLDARMHSRRLPNIGLTYLAYGSEVRVEPGALETFYLVQVPLRGKGSIQYGKQQVAARPGVAAVVGPTQSLDLRLDAELELVILRIERTALEAALSDLLNCALPYPVEFELGMTITGYARTWCDYLMFCVAEINRPDSLLSHPLSVNQMEQNLISGLLIAQRSNYSAMLHGHALPAPSRAISRAVDVIENHPEQARTVGSLARECGVSVRALQKGFRRYLDTTPSAFLRDVRLQRAHDELRAAQPDTVTVGEIAGRWGFLHVGRFATSYRRKFKESPSQTLHR